MSVEETVAVCEEAAYGEAWVKAPGATAATARALSALKPGMLLPGGNRVASERLMKLLWIKYGPWGAYKSALMEECFNDRSFTKDELDSAIEQEVVAHD